MYEACLKFLEGWGGGVLEKNPFCGGGMHIFWNYALLGKTLDIYRAQKSVIRLIGRS